MSDRPHKKNHTPPGMAFNESSAKLLQLIADYGAANFACGNGFSDDPDINASANDRANAAWLAILESVRARPTEQETR